MKKPIIATTLAGLFIKRKAWDKAHKIWYEDAAKKLKDTSILKWIGREDYFKGVDTVMQRLYPELNDEQRTIKARQMFFDSVIEYIRQNPDTRNDEIIEYFNSLKSEFRLALITTNTKQALEKCDRVCTVKIRAGNHAQPIRRVIGPTKPVIDNGYFGAIVGHADWT